MTLRIRLAGLFVLLAAFSSVSLRAESFSFSHGTYQLQGEYHAPKSQVTRGLIVFIHGDGAANADSNGFYPLYWQSLRRQGYYVASWSKAGVAGSSGNWLRQTMQDRQAEAISGINHLQTLLGISPQQTGLLAFSQGGWVAPAIATSEEHIGFLIGIGFARSWVEQGKYYNRLSGEEAAYIADVARLQQQLSNGVAPTDDRDWFVLNNFTADASDDYRHLAVPTLLLWGEDDLNVDSNSEYAYWQSNANPSVRTQLIPQATHQLLDSNKFPNRQLGTWDWLKFQWQGEKALAPTVLNEISQFIGMR